MEEAERERAREEAARKKFDTETNGQLGSTSRKWMTDDKEGEGEGQSGNEEEEGEEENEEEW
jgi:hypothetical protein